ITHILALRRIMEEAIRKDINLIAIFVDFKKAFDSIDRSCIGKILHAYNVPQQLIKPICAMYQSTTTSVQTSDGPTESFETTSGVLQGDSLSPFLFIIVMDWIIRTSIPDDSNGLVLNKRRSSRYPESRLSLAAYADDLALFSSTGAKAQRMLTNLYVHIRQSWLGYKPGENRIHRHTIY